MTNFSGQVAKINDLTIPGRGNWIRLILKKTRLARRVTTELSR